MIAEFTHHLWQSTFFALAAGLLTLAFRKNRAHVRYWLWLTASLKFFVPFALLVGAGSSLETHMPAAAHQIATPAVSYTIERFSGPYFAENLPATLPAQTPTDWIPIAIFSVWLCGFLAIALLRFRNWLRIRAAVRASTAIHIPGIVAIRQSPGLLEPGVVGLLRPILLLPEGITERLTPAELETILAHELCRIRRRDNLFASIHMLVEAIFWFHPLVWWIGARLVEERERACDEEVLRQGNQPDVYADAILNVCKLYLESPLVCVAGVTGASIRRRIEAIMNNRRIVGLNRAKKFLLATAGAVALAGPIAVGVIIGVGNAPVIRAQSPAPASKPKFDVVSVKPSADCAGGGGRGAGGGGLHASPGWLDVECRTVMSLIRMSYDNFANGKWQPRNIPIEGGPAWIKSDLYTIEAKAEGAPNEEMMRGPMMQAILEDRFRLKIRRETKEVPVYDLIVVKGGPKLQAFKEGSCTPFPSSPFPPVSVAELNAQFERGVRYCRYEINGIVGRNATVDMQATSLDQFAAIFRDMDRPIINKTGIAGLFDFRLVYAPDESTPGVLDSIDDADAGPPAGTSDPAGGPSIFTALQQQLGLKLVPAKGPSKYFVIDSVERPSEN